MGYNSQNDRSCSVLCLTNQSTSTGTAEALSWLTAEHNPNGLWVLATNPTRITIDKPGLYEISASVNWQAGVDNASSIIINKNGSATNLVGVAGVAKTAAGSDRVVGTLLLATGDYLEASVLQATGTINAQGRMSVHLVHPQQDWTAATEAQ